MFTELSLGCWLSGHIEIYTRMKFRLPQFFSVSYVHKHVSFIMHINSRLPSFIFVNAAVSEIRELNQNKEKKMTMKNEMFPIVESHSNLCETLRFLVGSHS